MTTDRKPLSLKTATDDEIAAAARRRLIESAGILAAIVRRKSGALLKLQKTGQPTAEATREVSAVVIAAQRTMEMKDRLDGTDGKPGDIARDEARRLLDLADAEIAEFLRRQIDGAAGARPRLERGDPGPRPASVAGDGA
jgi:hypothetical protein